jgi:hypothetical protein
VGRGSGTTQIVSQGEQLLKVFGGQGLNVASRSQGAPPYMHVPVFEPPLATISVEARRLGARWAQSVAG